MGNDTGNIKILCIGVGGAGTNVINRMKDKIGRASCRERV